MPWWQHWTHLSWMGNLTPRLMCWALLLCSVTAWWWHLGAETCRVLILVHELYHKVHLFVGYWL
jgi:hypothetical protein